MSDPLLDEATPEERERLVVSALHAQIEFTLARGVSFWSERLRRAGVSADRLTTTADFSRLPPLSKDALRSVPPWELVPASSRLLIERCYGTSGTTGWPVTIFWSSADWRALLETVARLLRRHRPGSDVLALNGYHQGHLAGPLYDGALRLLGGISIPRHYRLDDEAATIEQMRLFGCNTLVLPERSGLTKGGQAVEDLLRHDPELFVRCGVRWWIGSTSTFSEAIRDTAQRQGVASVTNLYGSSELGILGVSCRADPAQFHLALGHVFVEVVDGDGLPVRTGQRGRVVATPIFSSRPDGSLAPHEGSQLFRVDNGDEATFLDEGCRCGLASPRILDVRRSAPCPEEVGERQLRPEAEHLHTST